MVTRDPDRQFVTGLRYIDDLILRDRDTTGDGTLDERLYALQDANWNVTAITDENGDVQERYDYAAYSVPVFLSPAFAGRASSDFAWEYLFTCRPLDSTTKLQSNRRRYYHHQLGIWTSRDPVESDELNLYRYSLNNSTSMVDPSGLDSKSSTITSGKKKEQCDDVCGVDVTEWFRKDMISHLKYAIKYQNSIGGDYFDFRHQAAHLMSHKWIDFATDKCSTGKCVNTVRLATVCIRKNQLGNMMFAFIGRMYPPGKHRPFNIGNFGVYDTAKKVVAKGYSLGNVYNPKHPHAKNFGDYAGARRADNLAAFGIGYMVGQQSTIIYNKSQFETKLRQWLNRSGDLSIYADLYDTKNPPKFGPDTLTFVPEFGGFNTRSCKTCGAVGREYSSLSSSYRSIEAGQTLYKQWKAKGGGARGDEWRRKMYEDYTKNVGIWNP